jgi:hypothetical protein
MVQPAATAASLQHQEVAALELPASAPEPRDAEGVWHVPIAHVAPSQWQFVDLHRAGGVGSGPARRGGYADVAAARANGTACFKRGEFDAAAEAYSSALAFLRPDGGDGGDAALAAAAAACRLN